jgi:hypothetical protein
MFSQLPPLICDFSQLPPLVGCDDGPPRQGAVGRNGSTAKFCFLQERRTKSAKKE